MFEAAMHALLLGRLACGWMVGEHAAVASLSTAEDVYHYDREVLLHYCMRMVLRMSALSDA